MAESFRYPDDTYVKGHHKAGCDGALYRKDGIVNIDRAGRIGNGGWVAHLYVCNRSWDGCNAKVLVTEHAVRALAVEAEAG